jgi:hypothetical protein
MNLAVARQTELTDRRNFSPFIGNKSSPDLVSQAGVRHFRANAEADRAWTVRLENAQRSQTTGGFAP